MSTRGGVQIRSILWARKTCDTDEQIGRGRATLISDMGDVLAAHWSGDQAGGEMR